MEGGDHTPTCIHTPSCVHTRHTERLTNRSSFDPRGNVHSCDSFKYARREKEKKKKTNSMRFTQIRPSSQRRRPNSLTIRPYYNIRGINPVRPSDFSCLSLLESTLRPPFSLFLRLHRRMNDAVSGSSRLCERRVDFERLRGVGDFFWRPQ